MWGGVLESIGLLIAQHGEGLAGACGAVGKHCCIFPREDCLDEWLYSLRVDMFGGLIGIDAIEGISLFLGPVVNFKHLAIFLFKLAFNGIEDDLGVGGGTMRFSWMRMTFQSPEFISFWLRGRTRMATRMLD